MDRPLVTLHTENRIMSRALVLMRPGRCVTVLSLMLLIVNVLHKFRLVFLSSVLQPWSSDSSASLNLSFFLFLSSVLVCVNSLRLRGREGRVMHAARYWDL